MGVQIWHARLESNRDRGVGSPSTAPKAVVLPLHYGRVCRKTIICGLRALSRMRESNPLLRTGGTPQALKACVQPLHQFC